MIAALRSIATYVTVALYVVVLGPPCVLIAVLAGSPALLYRIALPAVRFGLFLSGIQYRAEGVEHIQLGRAAVYAVNHSSNIEPPVLFAVLRGLFPRLRILYKAELRKLPVLVQAFDLAGFVPLERGNPDQSMPAIERAAAALAEGNSFLIFPEGTRSRTGELLPFKKGGIIMALTAHAPVVPIAIKGARDAMQKGSPWIRPVTVGVRLGRPIETSGLSIDDRDEVTARVRGEIARMLGEM